MNYFRNIMFYLRMYFMMVLATSILLYVFIGAWTNPLLDIIELVTEKNFELLRHFSLGGVVCSLINAHAYPVSFED